jgi:hypothetical protein
MKQPTGKDDMADKIFMDRSALQAALDWADSHGEQVFFTGGMKSVDAMNSWSRPMREALAAPQPAGCCFPACKSESYQNELHEQLNQEFFTGTPQPAQPSDIPKLGCINHDCDKCKAVQTEPEH